LAKQSERVVFENTVKALCHAVEERLTPEAREELRQAGLDLGRPLLPAYPAEQWARMLGILARTAFPGQAEEEQQRLLGRAVMESWRNTLVGRAAETMARLVGPQRTLARMSHNLRSSDNFCETRLTPSGPHEAELWVSEVLGMPAYYQGIVERVLEAAGAPRHEVQLVSRQGDACTYRVRWN
jgi:uncharacterized protein (TIGR02265 family)